MGLFTASNLTCAYGTTNVLHDLNFSLKERLFYGSGRNTLSYTAAWTVFKKYLEKAGLSHKNYSPHCLRHTFATTLLNARMPIEVLRDLLGHKTLEQTRRYANLSDRTREEEYFRAMNIIEGGRTNE